MENCKEKDFFDRNPIKKLEKTSQEMKSSDCKISGPRIFESIRFVLRSKNDLVSKGDSSSLISGTEKKDPDINKKISLGTSKAPKIFFPSNQLTLKLNSRSKTTKIRSNRRSISLFQKSPASKSKNKKNNISKVNIINLEEMFFRQKLERFIKNLRTHSSVNDMSRLSLDKLNIINDLSSYPSKLLEDGNFSGVRKESNNLWNKKGKKKSTAAAIIIHKLIINVQMIIQYFESLMKIILCLIEENVPVIKPFSKFKFFWDFVMLFLTAWNLLSLSLLISFKISLQESFSFSIPLLNREGSLLGFQVVCLILYSLDILMKFNTSYYWDGESVQDRKKIIKNYITAGLLFDVLGTIPFWQFLNDGERSMHLYLLLFKVYPLLNFFKNINEALLDIDGKLEATYYLTKLLLTVLFFCHSFACLWHFQAISRKSELNWLLDQNLADCGWTVRYVRSLYFVVVTMTTVGYGDISPTNNTEYLIAMTCMLIGSGLIGFSINSIGAIQKKKNKRDNDFRNKIQVMNNYFKKNNVSDSIKTRVRKYLEYICKIEDSFNDKKSEEIMKELPKTLREEILTQTRAAGLEALFSGKFKSSTIKKIAQNLTLAQYSKEEWIFMEGEEEGNNLYIMVKGAVDLILNEGKENKKKFIKLDSKKAGEPVGVFPFMIDQPKNFSLKAASVCSLLKISKDKFIEILKEDPEDYETYCMLRDRIFLYDEFSALGRKCKSCGDNNHYIMKCPYLNYVPFKSILICKHLHSETQERRRCRRKSKQKMKYTHTLLKTKEIRESLEQFKEERPADNIQNLRFYSELLGNDGPYGENVKEFNTFATEVHTPTRKKDDQAHREDFNTESENPKTIFNPANQTIFHKDPPKDDHSLTSYEEDNYMLVNDKCTLNTNKQGKLEIVSKIDEDTKNEEFSKHSSDSHLGLPEKHFEEQNHYKSEVNQSSFASKSLVVLKQDPKEENDRATHITYNSKKNELLLPMFYDFDVGFEFSKYFYHNNRSVILQDLSRLPDKRISKKMMSYNVSKFKD